MIGAAAVTGGRRRGGAVADPELAVDYDFTAMSALPAGWTFTGTAGGSYTDAAGAAQTAGANTPRFDHNPSTLAPLGLLFGGQSELATVSLSGTTFSTTTGTILVDFMFNASSSGALGRIVSVDNNTADGTERLAAFYVDAGEARSQYRPSGTTIYSARTQGSSLSTVLRAAFAYAAANGNTYGNGLPYGTLFTGTNASVTVPFSPTMVRLGNSIAGDRPYVGWIRRLRIYNVRKSDADLATLTAVT
jgi:hypothetical protein